MTITLPRVPNLIIGLVLGLGLVGGFMAVDSAYGHWYVQEVASVRSQVERQRGDILALRADIRELRTSISDLESRETSESIFFDSVLDRDIAINRIAQAVTVNALVNNIGGFQTSTSPRGKLCEEWLLGGAGSQTDCGFVPVE